MSILAAMSNWSLLNSTNKSNGKKMPLWQRAFVVIFYFIVIGGMTYLIFSLSK